MDDDLFLPPPTPSEAKWVEYERTGFEPLFFEWYKFAASVLNVLSAIQPNSPAFHCADARHYYVMSGLMHRCARLMAANVALSHEGSFGETAAIVDRSLCESAIRIQWLGSHDSDRRILRFLTDSLRPEIEFENTIRANISRRGGETLVIEERMLKSIQNHIDAAGVTRDQIAQAKRLPDLATMLESLGHERLAYIVIQRMGSHHIHGTWPSLLFHYLTESEEVEGYRFRPKHGPVPMHINQYMQGSRFALEAGATYCAFFLSADEADAFQNLCVETIDEMMAHYKRATAEDREPT